MAPVRAILTVALIAVALTVIWRAGGWHVVHKPTPDQLFGCDWTNTDLPSGECK